MYIDYKIATAILQFAIFVSNDQNILMIELNFFLSLRF